MKMKSAIAILAILCLVGVFSTSAFAEVITNDKVPFTATVFVPCANGGTGENVDISGTLHVLCGVTLDGKDGFHAHAHFQLQDASGTGQITGDKYQASGVLECQINGKVGVEFTKIFNAHIIGQGPGNNATIHLNCHLTVNANGDVTAMVDNFNADCK
jgi:hypothetical protein